MALLAGGLLGALLLVVAEFTTLYELHVSSSITPVSSTTTGAHNSYALIPIGLLAAGLTLAAARGIARRPALLALALLGVVALLVALIGDLPDAHAHGITSNLKFATTSAGEGLYLETLGGILLLLTGGAGLIGLAPTRDPGRGRTHKPTRGRTARSES